ncbi:poxB regulator PoxA [Nitrincola sp. A-D6]|uniref:EF-P lysine aminoacylase EpmA n=1 Tax=Nitrincola sp. A-D6 TaxID=1545442 RepID=UPI00051FEBF5|nr:EF-P lysine aminoacylase EpmA [Nitrincola sp. A-D6]KGK41856.1 poxB regulator PoxA [Nitrincola sp. A-D6]
MSVSDWQPSAPLENLRQRAALLAQLRAFFAQRDVMEVDTQILSHCAVSDPFIDSIVAQYQAVPGGPSQSVYLQTSPEYAMKRLLAAGSGAIYQLGKVFRNGESGRRHNPEFTLLEWYRPGFGLSQLMDEVETLVAAVLPHKTWRRIAYRDLFMQTLRLDPFLADVASLRDFCRQHIEAAFEDDDRDTWLNLLMSHLIEPQLQGAVFVHSYPPTQAALAKVCTLADGSRVAERFELYVDGLELANGYHELADAQEQAVRLQADQQQRHRLALPERPLETRLIQALEQGLPDCSGVALGVDRLLMCQLDAQTIAEVLPFSFERA